VAIPKDGGIERVGFLRATGLGVGFLRATGLGVGFLRATGFGGAGFLLATGAGFLLATGFGGAGFLLATGLGVSTLGATALFLGVTGREGRRTLARLLLVGATRTIGSSLAAVFLDLLRLPPRIISTYQKDFVNNCSAS
jgi:hypothetical protein